MQLVICSKPCTVVIRGGYVKAILSDTNSLDSLHRDITDDMPTLDCKGKIVTPGLIDPHTHLIFAGSRAEEFENRLNGMSYEAIAQSGGGINSTVRATREATIEELVEMALPRLDNLIRSGCTTIEVKSGYGLTLDDEVKMLLAAKALENHRRVNITTTLLAAHTVPSEYHDRPDDYIDYVTETIILMSQSINSLILLMSFVNPSVSIYSKRNVFFRLRNKTVSRLKDIQSNSAT
ncbi:imidazolonepropionase [Vibrio maritimus]|uniref:imidazolonepropionase n=1 Tax=Vibrio maritimus TaxID=990268 RepID=A0A090TBV6_9VIBR|nr:imidazolonepropionase [Vibrio maritimus]